MIPAIVCQQSEVSRRREIGAHTPPLPTIGAPGPALKLNARPRFRPIWPEG